MANHKVQSVDRAFQLLELMADEGGAVSLSQLAERSKLPLPTIHRLMRSLVGQGYVRQEPSRRYALGPRLIRIGEAANQLIGSWAMPYLRELVEEIGETANMAMLQGDSVVYVAQVPSPHSMRMFTEVGRRVFPHCTGVGKALLSTLPEEQVRAVIARTGMPAQTDNTLTDLPALLTELARSRERGYAVDEGEQEPGVRCVAVPVDDAPVRVGISISGPSSRVPRERVPEIAPVLQRVAADLVADLRGDQQVT